MAGYQRDGERVWWWKVALHLDEAQIALTNAMSHNTDAPPWVHGLHDKLREGQSILLDIFRAKGLLPPPTAAPSQPPAQVTVPEASAVVAAQLPADLREVPSPPPGIPTLVDLPAPPPPPPPPPPPHANGSPPSDDPVAEAPPT